MVGQGRMGLYHLGWQDRVLMAQNARQSWKIGGPSTPQETKLFPALRELWMKMRQTTLLQYSTDSTISKLALYISLGF